MRNSLKTSSAVNPSFVFSFFGLLGFAAAGEVNLVGESGWLSSIFLSSPFSLDTFGRITECLPGLLAPTGICQTSRGVRRHDPSSPGGAA